MAFKQKKTNDMGGSIDLRGPSISLGSKGPDLGGSTLNLGGPSLSLGQGRIAFGGEEEEEDERTGDLEVDGREGLEKVMSAFQLRAKAEERRMEDVTDTEFWFAMCFETREQKEEFLQKLKLLDLGDKYLDGLAAAKILGVKLEAPRQVWPRVRLNKRLVALT